MNSLQQNAEAGKDLWLTYLRRGGTIRELRGLDQGQMEAIYQLGFSHFGIGHYAEALKVFRYLALLAHLRLCWSLRYLPTLLHRSLGYSGIGIDWIHSHFLPEGSIR